MIIGLLRHAIAEDAREATGFDDAARALTAGGSVKMTRAARGIRRLDLGFQLVLTSPLVRCLQTADIVARSIGRETRVDDRLRPGLDAERLLDVLTNFPQIDRVLVCGHEPDMSDIAFDLLRGGVLDFKKGALAVIELDAPPRIGAGTLVGHYPPRALRALGGEHLER